MFTHGFVTYANAAKIELLGVSAADLETHGAVSETVACQMAAGALQASGADIAVAVTGIAGPGWRHAGKTGRHRMDRPRGERRRAHGVQGFSSTQPP